MRTVVRYLARTQPSSDRSMRAYFARRRQGHGSAQGRVPRECARGRVRCELPRARYPTREPDSVMPEMATRRMIPPCMALRIASRAGIARTTPRNPRESDCRCCASVL